MIQFHILIVFCMRFQGGEDEDEEPTLSTDCLTYVDTAAFIESIPTTATRVLEEIINKKVVPKTSFDSQKTLEYCVSCSASRPSSALHAPPTPPILRSPNSRIQKQISLYERDSGPMIQPDSMEMINSKKSPSTRRNAEFYRFLSVDQRSISDTEDNVSCSQYEHEWDKPSCKTKSCANLKISCAAAAPQSAPHSPGAVLVKEKYIDLPKRAARSFHGKTDAETANGCIPNGQKPKPRFTTTRVNESELSDNSTKEN